MYIVEKNKLYKSNQNGSRTIKYHIGDSEKIINGVIYLFNESTQRYENDISYIEVDSDEIKTDELKQTKQMVSDLQTLVLTQMGVII